MENTWLNNPLHPYASFTNAHLNSIETIQWSPINNELASGSHDMLVKIWDINKMKEASRFAGHKYPYLYLRAGVWSLVYSLDGKQVISGSPDKSLLVWDVKSGKNVSSLREHKNMIYWVSVNDQFMASGGSDGHVIVWDVRKMRLFKDLEVSNDIIYNVHFMGNLMCTSDSNGSIKIYNTTNFEKVAQNNPTYVNKAYVMQSLKNADNSYTLISGQKNKTLRTYQLHGSNLDWVGEQLVHSDAVHSLKLVNGLVITGARDGACRVWEKGQAKYNLLGHNQRVTGTEFKQVLATCSWDQNINFYKI